MHNSSRNTSETIIFTSFQTVTIYRVGGNFSVAFALFTKRQRGQARQKLGKKLVFIVLKMTRTCMRKRLAARHGGDENSHAVDSIVNMHSLYEDVGEDEPQAYTVTVDENTTKNDVITKVLDIMEKHQD